MKSLLCRPMAVVIVLAASGVWGSGAGRASATPVGQSTVSGRDRTWMATMRRANLAEIQVGELAQRKGHSHAVRSAGAMLVTDHTRSDEDVKRIAADLGIELPDSPAPADAAAAARLGDESGKQFDRDFVSTMATGHEEVIAKTRAEIAHGSAPQVKRLARKTLPTLRKHLATIRRAGPAD